MAKVIAIDVPPLELLTLAVVVVVEVLYFIRPVYVHVRHGDGGATDVVGSPSRTVRRRNPAVADGTAVIAPLKERG